MNSLGRCNTGGHDNYLMNQQAALPEHEDGNEFMANSPNSYNFSQHSFNSYISQFSPPYSQQSNLTPSAHLSQYPSGHSNQSISVQTSLPHQPPQYISQPRYLQSPRYLPLRDALGETDIESQESRNESTMLSEPVIPPLDGFPDVREFDQLMKSYVDDLSVKKQDKALIHARRARNIKMVLIDPKDTAIESAQFRFWVKKMFKLQTVGIGTPDCRKMVCHEGKPVAIREKLFKILTKAHQQCQHGGRDKTSAQVRRIYSWVPKELISRFVKICPTCQVRRGGLRLTPPNSRRGSPRLELMARSPKIFSSLASRRESLFGGHISLERPQTDCYAQMHSHSGWVSNQQGVPGRSNMDSGSLQSCGDGTIGTVQGSISSVLDPFTDSIPMASQLGYSSGYIATHGNSGARGF
ncbi:hypothetical protein MPDQ_004297 [Monascus purpureus]|uniref:Integrase zinc-binding domain-containing protein n=1 Tax=Monascus purpureus TaxID=5098 RepID=A0A507QLX5_MONPU|nr:hypothetical protein MPDQ_004297 [Monascus purpureus]